MTAPVPAPSMLPISPKSGKRMAFALKLPWIACFNTLLTAALLAAYLEPGERCVRVLLPLLGLAALWILPCYLALYLPMSLLPARRPWLWSAGLLVATLEGLRTTILLMDLQLFRIMGVHLYSRYVVQSLTAPQFIKDIGAGPGTFAGLLALWLGVSAVQALWLLGLSKLGPSIQRRVWIPLVLLAFLMPWPWTLTADAQAILARALPGGDLGQPPDKNALSLQAQTDHLLARRKATHYPLQPFVPPAAPLAKRPDIVMVMVETLRADMFNAENMPLTWQIAKENQGLTAQHHYSGGHQTWEGTFSLLYSLGGWQRDTFRDQPWKSQPLLMLRQLGYRTVALTSSSLDHSGYKAMAESFDSLENFNQLPPVTGDAQATDRAIALVHARDKLPLDQQKPLFILVFYNATHYPFVFSPAHERYQPFAPPDTAALGPDEDYRVGLWNRYRNAVQEVDAQMGRLWQALLPERQAGSLAWVMLGDHGEEFWDHGLYGHASRRLDNARTQTPFWLSFPGLKRTQVAVSSHYDVFPTLFDLLHVPSNATDWSDGQTLLQPRTADYVELNGYNFPESELFAIATPRLKVFARRTPGFALEINEVTDIDDRPTPWALPDVADVLHEFQRRVDHFQPNFRLLRSDRISVRRVPGYPLPQAPGPARTANHPERLPWARLQDGGLYVTREAPQVEIPLHLKWLPYVELVGATVRNKTVQLGDVLVVELVFHCLQTPPPELEVFFHMDAPSPPGWQNIGHTPVSGAMPPSKWQKGDYIRDSFEVPTLQYWQPGEALIRVGFYDSKTDKRLTVEGQKTQNNNAIVATVQFVPAAQ